MNTTTERVTKLLNGQSTRGTDDSSGAGASADDEPTALSRDDLKAAVKEGVTEALDEREASSEADDEPTDESTDDDASSGSSRLRTAVSLLTTIGVLGAIAYVRRRRATGTDDEEATHTQTLDDQP